MPKPQLAICVLSLGLLASCSTPPTARLESRPAPPRSDFSRVAEPVAPRFVPAGDPRFVCHGRIDRANPAGPILIWQASRISVDFEGEKLGLRWGPSLGQNCFDVEIDGVKHLLIIPPAKAGRDTFLPPLGPGRHQLSLFKRTEANAGTARFEGIEVADDAHVRTPAPEARSVQMEFIGDSITAGACDEDGAEDQWEDRSTHNGALSYAALTAAAFDADYRNISVSGMGVVTGWVNKRAVRIWDRLYPETSSVRADLSDWTPRVVFVNLGENDDSFTRAKRRPFPAAFADEYERLGRQIRRTYPGAQIVLLRGGMFGGAKSPALRAAWEKAVARLEAGDPRIHHFIFTHWSEKHPRVPDHRAMADELIAWLRSREFMHPAPAIAPGSF